MPVPNPDPHSSSGHAISPAKGAISYETSFSPYIATRDAPPSSLAPAYPASFIDGHQDRNANVVPPQRQQNAVNRPVTQRAPLDLDAAASSAYHPVAYSQPEIDAGGDPVVLSKLSELAEFGMWVEGEWCMFFDKGCYG